MVVGVIHTKFGDKWDMYDYFEAAGGFGRVYGSESGIWIEIVTRRCRLVVILYE